ncbi:MAG: hypothetical protein ABTQ32_28110 [Myxococcaceae bacterium]
MVALLLSALVVAQTPAPPSVVVVTRRAGLSATDAQALANQVSTVLTQQGVPLTLAPDAASQQLKKLGLPDAASCAGKRDCIVELGRQLHVTWVFSMSVARVEKDRSLGLELVNVDDGQTLEKDGLVLAPKSAVAAEQLTTFIAAVKKRLAPPPPADVPVVVTTTPKPVEPPVELPPPPPPPTPERSHVGSFVLGGIAAGALIGAGVTLGLGLMNRAELTGSVMNGVSSLPRSRATLINTQANTQFILSAALGAVAVALGTIAVIVW